MYDYPPMLAGRDIEPEQWCYSLRASAMLDDAFGVITLKRSLDRGAEPPLNDDRVVGRVGIASAERMSEALAEARKAQPEWARRPLKERLQFGYAVHHEIVRRSADFVDILVAEGHPRRLAQWEVTGVCAGTSPETLDAQAEMMDMGKVVAGRAISLVRKADGVVCLSPPRNAAASTSVLGLLSMVAGNALVMKAPRSTPLGVSWVWRDVIAPVMAEFDVPPGILSLMCGDPEEVVAQWLDSPDVDDIMYFGSSSRGLELEAKCVARGIKPVLELAGNDGLLVWADANLKLAARAVTECFYGSSQICMVPKYVIAHPAIAEALIAEVIELIKDVRPGPPEDPEVLLTPVLKTNDFYEFLEDALERGAILLAGGERTDHHGNRVNSGVFLEPTLLRVDGLAAAEDIKAVREETFFPLLPIVVPDASSSILGDCLTFMDANLYGLRNSMWASDPEVIDAFCGLRNGGLLKVNDSHIGFVGGLPTHGGTGRTGGAFGECNFPMLRTSHLQGISVAVAVSPPEAVFDSAELTT